MIQFYLLKCEGCTQFCEILYNSTVTAFQKFAYKYNKKTCSDRPYLSTIGPIVSLNTSVLDFGCVEEDTEVTHNVQIINCSAVLAHYQFDVDTGSHSVFSIDKPCGSLPGSSKLTLRVKFHPYQPIAYHKTVTCLLLHRVICLSVCLLVGFLVEYLLSYLVLFD